MSLRHTFLAVLLLLLTGTILTAQDPAGGNAPALGQRTSTRATTDANCAATRGQIQIPDGAQGVNLRVTVAPDAPRLCDAQATAASEVLIHVSGAADFTLRWTPGGTVSGAPAVLAPGTYQLAVSNCRTCSAVVEVGLQMIARVAPPARAPAPTSEPPAGSAPSPTVARLLESYRAQLQQAGLHEQFTRQSGGAEQSRVALDPAASRQLQTITEGFLNDLGAQGLTLQDLQRFRAAAERANASGGDPLFPGQRYWDANFLGTERALMAGRTQVVEAAWNATLEQLLRTHPEAAGVVYGRLDVGSWAKNTLGGLSFAGDIDFSSVSIDPRMNTAVREIFSAQLRQRTGLFPIQADTVHTAQGQAGAEVFIGEWGSVFAEFDVLKRGSWTMLVPETKDGVTTVRPVMRPASDLFWERAFRTGEEVKFPEWSLDREPMFSLEMLRHGIHDVEHGPFSRGQQLVKMLKYAERSYFWDKKAVAEVGWNPYAYNDPMFADFATKVLEAKNNPAVLAEMMRTMAGEELTERNVDAVVNRLIARAKTVMHDNAARSLAFRLQRLAAIGGDLEREQAAHKLWTDLQQEVNAMRTSGVEVPEVMRQAAEMAGDLIEGRLSPEDLDRRARDLHRLLDEAYKIPSSVIARISLWGPLPKLRAYLRSKQRWTQEQVTKFIEAANRRYPGGAAKFEALYQATTELNEHLERTTSGNALLGAANFIDNAFQVYDAYQTGRTREERLWATAHQMAVIAALQQGLQIPYGLYQSVSSGSPGPAAMAVTFTYFPFVGQLYMAGSLMKRANTAAYDMSFYNELDRMLEAVDVDQSGRITRFVLRQSVNGNVIDEETVSPAGNRARIADIFENPTSAFYVAPNFNYWRRLVPTPDDRFGRYEDKLENLRRFFPDDEFVASAVAQLAEYRAHPEKLPKDQFAPDREAAMAAWEQKLRVAVWNAMADALESAARTSSNRVALDDEIRKIEGDLAVGDDHLGRGKGLLSRIQEEVSARSGILSRENIYSTGIVYDRYLRAYKRVQAIRDTIVNELWLGRFHIDGSAAQSGAMKILLAGPTLGAPALTGVPETDVALAEASLAAHRSRADRMQRDLEDAMGRPIEPETDRGPLRQLGQIGIEWEHLLDGIPSRSATEADEATGAALTQRFRDYRAVLDRLSAPDLTVAIDGATKTVEGRPVELRASVAMRDSRAGAVPQEVRTEWFVAGQPAGASANYVVSAFKPGAVEVRVDAVRQIGSARRVLGSQTIHVDIAALTKTPAPEASAKDASPPFAEKPVAPPEKPVPATATSAAMEKPAEKPPEKPLEKAPEKPLVSSLPPARGAPGAAPSTGSSLEGHWKLADVQDTRDPCVEDLPGVRVSNCAVTVSGTTITTRATVRRDFIRAPGYTEPPPVTVESAASWTDPPKTVASDATVKTTLTVKQMSDDELPSWATVKGNATSGLTSGSRTYAVPLNLRVGPGRSESVEWTLEDGSLQPNKRMTIEVSHRGPGGGLTRTYAYAWTPGPPAGDFDVTVIVDRPAPKLGDTVTLSARVTGGTPPYQYTWTGPATGTSAALPFAVSKPGRHDFIVVVADAKGAKASTAASVEAKTYVARISLDEGSRRIVPGQALKFSVEVSSPDGVAPPEGLVFRWQPNTEVAFRPFEGPARQATGKFPALGSFKVWVDVLQTSGPALSTLAESNQIDIEVVKPEINLRVSPPQPYPGQMVRVTASEEPVVDALINYWWEYSGSALNAGAEANPRVYSFKPKDATPVKVIAHARAVEGGADLGSKEIVVTARSHDVQVTGPRFRGPKPQVWNPQRGELVDVESGFAVFQDISMRAEVTPAPSNPPLRYAWTVSPEGCTISNPAAQEPTFNCSQTGGFNAAVIVRDNLGAMLGTGAGQVSISISQASLQSSRDQAEASKKATEAAAQKQRDEQAKRVTAQRLRAEATALQQEGKLREAVVKYREALTYVPDPALEAHIAQVEAAAARREAAPASPQTANREKAAALHAEGKALQDQGKLRDAAAKYRESLRYVPNPALDTYVAQVEAEAARREQPKPAADPPARPKEPAPAAPPAAAPKPPPGSSSSAPPAAAPPATTRPAEPPAAEKPAPPPKPAPAPPRPAPPPPAEVSCQVSGTYEGGNEEGTLALALRQSGDQLEGTLAITPKGEDTERAGVRGSFARPSIRLTAPAGDGQVTITGNASNDCRAMRVSITVDGETQTFALVRK